MKSYNRTMLNVNTSTEGETIEQKVARAMHNNEPIKDGAPLIYTEREAGTMPGYNIRTDRWEIALEAMDSVHRGKAAKRDNKMEIVKDDDKPAEPENGKTESTQGT